MPGTYIIALHYKGREKAILEMDLKIDDLLEKASIYPYYANPGLCSYAAPFCSKRTTSIFSIWSTSS